MSADSADRLRALPEVEAVDTFRAYEISYNGKPATLGGGEVAIAADHQHAVFVSGKRSTRSLPAPGIGTSKPSS